ncbi:hypothetical protein [Pontibacter liquoris]|uniref:hypothetical protein n=1 Tax=Pontibacter liquoris TaxID=2905677 RepID=UPI001FA7CF64|nr:hypothetical protein [Pontibacter liquoris]
MRFTLLFKPVSHLVAGVFLSMILLSSCQQTTEEKPPATAQQSAEMAPADTVQKRPAPTFFIIPPEMASKHVWLCENATADVFHLKHDCPVLVACRGKGTFRNVSLVRAIETYGRYNCQTCSKELDTIFDEDMVR